MSCARKWEGYVNLFTYPSDEVEQCIHKDIVVRSRAARRDSEEIGYDVGGKMGLILLNACGG
jgi:hypothetical protein